MIVCPTTIGGEGVRRAAVSPRPAPLSAVFVNRCYRSQNVPLLFANVFSHWPTARRLIWAGIWAGGLADDGETHSQTDGYQNQIAQRPGLFADGDGLYVRVTGAGTRGWIFRFKLGGHMRDMGLGTHPSVSLAEARELAGEARALVRRGIDPIDARKQQAPPAVEKHIVTFDEAAKRYIGAHEQSWRNAKHRQQWANTLSTYAGPIISKTDVAAIGTDDVLRILEPIWQEKPETASRVRGRIENVLDWAKVRGLRDGANPAAWRGHLNHLLPSRNKARSVKHHAALPWRELPEFMTELRTNSSISAMALEFTILTAVRTSESIGARWSEIDLKTGVWAIPADRMKASREHRVPIAGPAVALLEALPRVEGNPFLFPGARRGRPLSNMAMLELVRGMRPGLTVHGFRSTFRDWTAENTAFPRELAEAALAHILGNATERAYQRGDLFEKRRKLMDAWVGYCGRGTMKGEVIALANRR